MDNNPFQQTANAAAKIGDMRHKVTAIIQKEEDMFVALCPELDIASQGYTIEEAKKNLEEAVTFF